MRVVVPAHASPDTTCPDELCKRSKKSVRKRDKTRVTSRAYFITFNLSLFCNLKHITETKKHVPKSLLFNISTVPSGRFQGGNLRERADTLGRVANVPHLDVRGGDGEDETGGRTVFD